LDRASILPWLDRTARRHPLCVWQSRAKPRKINSFASPPVCDFRAGARRRDEKLRHESRRHPHQVPAFLRERGHTIVPSSSLVPANDRRCCS